VLAAAPRRYQQYFKKARMMTEVHAAATAQKGEASGAADDEAGADGESGEKKRPVDSKAAEKRKQDKKKSLKRCNAPLAPAAQPPHSRRAPPAPRRWHGPAAPPDSLPSTLLPSRLVHHRL
tara:strand:+ start:1002 stop:1364 length:363 start_codon:yes stop_codon:yes gene_type:complete